MLTRTGKVVFALAVFFVLFGILCIGGMIILWSLIESDSVDSPPATYAIADVASVCELFEVDAADPFCANPENQHVFAFEDMLGRRFPRGTNYEQIAPLLAGLEGYAPCEHGSRAAYTLNNCPPPDQCDHSYACYFRMPPTIERLAIFFTDTGRIIKFEGLKHEDY